MARQIVMILLGVMLLFHAVGFSMAAAQGSGNSLAVSIEAQADGSQISAPLGDRGDKDFLGRGFSQQLSPCHDHCNWVAETIARQFRRTGNVHTLAAPAVIASITASVSVPPPR